MQCLIITSADYIGTEMVAEFGLVPPAFLPVGNKRLYEHQIEIFHAYCERIILTLPDTFLLPDRDLSRLRDLNIELIFLPPNIPLAQSLKYALNTCGTEYDKLHVLHGDTLFKGVNFDLIKDGISVNQVKDAYNWAFFDPRHTIRFSHEPRSDNSIEGSSIVSGYFSFSDTARIEKMLARANGNFLKAINLYDAEIPLSIIMDGTWLDFGHLQTFYQSRGLFTTERVFNNLQIETLTVTKASSDNVKIQAESNWYENIPVSLKPYTAPYFGSVEEEGITKYFLGNMLNATLAELFVFGRLNFNTWQKIFLAIREFLEKSRNEMTDKSAGDFEHLYRYKTIARLSAFFEDKGLAITEPWLINGAEVPSPLVIVEEMWATIKKSEPINAIMHGDLCFSNIFYDFRSNTIKTIDPRGSVDGIKYSIFGDQRYDIAKLFHSTFGLYDFIVGGFYTLRRETYDLCLNLPSDDYIFHCQEALLSTRDQKFDPAAFDIRAINILLFFSMLPLHAENEERQWALFANALRLYLEHKGRN